MCVSPKKLGTAVYLPCGDCFECRMHKVNDWATRLIAESYTTPPTVFLTLTYNEESLPRRLDGTPCFDRDHLKQVCREITRVKPLRYYAIAEHGTDKERPHYHLVCFGVDAMTIDCVLQRYWKDKGFYTIGDRLEARLLYVALFHVLKSHNYPDEFTVMSRRPGIGAYFFEHITKDGRKLHKSLKDSRIIKDLFKAKDGRIQLGGEIRLLPRYMLDQLDDALKADVKDARRVYAYKRLSKFSGLNITDHYDAEQYMWNWSKDDESRWLGELHEVNRRKTDNFVKRHRKSRHVDSVK